MQAKMIIFPSEDGFNVLLWGQSIKNSMRSRHFQNRDIMVALLENLRLITPQQALELLSFSFLDSCPLYSFAIDEGTLAAHDFRQVDTVPRQRETD